METDRDRIESIRVNDLDELALLFKQGSPIQEELIDDRYFATFTKQEVKAALKHLLSPPLKDFLKARQQARRRIFAFRKTKGE